MTSQDLLNGRRRASMTQANAARQLGVSQPYLSQLENGTRVPGSDLAHLARKVYSLPPTVLPVDAEAAHLSDDDLMKELAGLGYPGFEYVRFQGKTNPAQVVLAALSNLDRDVRLVEGLPWVLRTYTDLNWPWLRDQAKLRNAQNRLGYLVHLARLVAENLGQRDKVLVLSRWEAELEQCRLATEGTLCYDTMSEPEKRWMRLNRPRPAEHWNLLTTITTVDLQHGND